MAFLGCAPGDASTGDVVLLGEHIDVEIEEGLEPCGDLVGHMDRFIELVAAEWQVDLADRHYGFRWLSVDTYVAEKVCSSGSLGCAHPDHVDSLAAPHDHELVHLVSFAVGRPPSFFIEGAAVAFDLPGILIGDGKLGDTPISVELLTSSGLPGPAYQLAGAYTRYLIDRFGMAAYLEFYAGLKGSAGSEAMSLAHAEVFGESLDATISGFDAERRDCRQEQFRFKLLECAAPGLAWEGDTLRLQRDVSCDEDDVVGPFFSGARAVTWASFVVDEPGLYEVSSAGGPVNFVIGSCGGCEAPPPIRMSSIMGPRRVMLDAGAHYLQLEVTNRSDVTVTLELRRVVP